ncbi:MAG: NAD(P)/FAD-dependent oxidoreductase [Bacteroidota bacterium]
MKKIIIIGGGFAGLNLAKQLRNNPHYQITIVDRNNYVFFPPLLYQVATGFLEPSNISYPYRKMLRRFKNARFKIGEVEKVVPDSNKIILSTGELDYDILVFATGTKTNFFGMENVQKNAIPMKTVNDALEMRNYLLSQMEIACTLSKRDDLTKALNIVVAGGGPTGVEISGMLAEMRQSIFIKDYPELAKKKVVSHIYLVDGGSELLGPMSKKSQEDTYNALSKLGVEIILNTRVQDFIDDTVILNDGRKIHTKNLIWAAGVTGQLFDGIPADSFGPGKRLLVDAYNQLINFNNIYSIGDSCVQSSDINFPNGHPQVAQVALQQGKNLGKNFLRMNRNQPLIPFNYKDKGSMAIIGRNKAVVDIPPRFHFKGFFAWFIWVFIHLMSLVHYRNRVLTFVNWVIAYFTKDQALRMIIRPAKKSEKN